MSDKRDVPEHNWHFDEFALGVHIIRIILREPPRPVDNIRVHKDGSSLGARSACDDVIAGDFFHIKPAETL